MNLDDYAYLFASPSSYRDFIKALEDNLSKHENLVIYAGGKLVGLLKK